MSNRTNLLKLRGSAIIWILVWLTGLAGIAWAGYTRALPRFEKKLQVAVEKSIEPHADLPIEIVATGRNVTLTGPVATEEARQSILDASQNVLGIGLVEANLTVGALDENGDSATDSSQIAQAPSDATTVPLPPEDLNDLVAPDSANTLTTIELPPNPNTQPEPVSVETTESTDNNNQWLVADEVNNQDDTESPTDSEVASDDTLTSEQDNESADSTLTSTESQNEQAVPTQRPSISLRIAGQMLAIEGTLAPSDNTSELVKQALDSFGLNVVSNGLTQSDSVMSAEWLDSLQRIISLMQPMTNPRIDVQERQVTLAGIAPTRAVHDAIITEALSSLGDYSLVERISIAQTQTEQPTKDPVQLAGSSVVLDSTEFAESTGIAEPETSEELLEPIESTELPEPAESTETAETTESVETPESTETSEPAETTELVESTKPPEESEPEESTETAESTEPAETAEPEESTETAEPTESAETAEPEESTETTEPAESTETTDPTESTETAEPEESTETAESTESAETTEPAESTESADTAEPTESAESSESAESEPVETLESNESAETDMPAEPTESVEPVEPVEPTAPSVIAPPITLDEHAEQLQNKELRKALENLPTLRILFQTDVNVLTEESKTVLDQIADVLLRFSETKVVIEGHTDSTGDRALNLRLSLLRATTVRDYLINKGVSVYNLRAVGYGEEVPIADNRSAEGRAINRRIDFTF